MKKISNEERVFIGLGSNMHNPLVQISTVKKTLNNNHSFSDINLSPLYKTKAVSSIVQPDFINAVLSVKTTLNPFSLLQYLQSIELKQGRLPLNDREKWGPRPIDLDILLYGNRQINTPELTVPHPYLKKRSFVLKPLFDLAPELVFPDGVLLLAVINELEACNEYCITS